MSVRKGVVAVFAVLSGILLLSQPATAYAWRGHDDHGRYHRRHGHYHDRYCGHYRHYPRYGYRPAVVFPGKYVTVIFGGERYYYSNRCYYRRVADRYIEVAPPQEVLVSSSRSHESRDNSGKTFIVNVPNSRGSYDQVALKGTEDGYIGPQGEFYDEFPDIEQLRIMYAK